MRHTRQTHEQAHLGPNCGSLCSFWTLFAHCARTHESDWPPLIPSAAAPMVTDLLLVAPAAGDTLDRRTWLALGMRTQDFLRACGASGSDGCFSLRCCVEGSMTSVSSLVAGAAPRGCGLKTPVGGGIGAGGTNSGVGVGLYPGRGALGVASAGLAGNPIDGLSGIISFGGELASCGFGGCGRPAAASVSTCSTVRTGPLGAFFMLGRATLGSRQAAAVPSQRATAAGAAHALESAGGGAKNQLSNWPRVLFRGPY